MSGRGRVAAPGSARGRPPISPAGKKDATQRATRSHSPLEERVADLETELARAVGHVRTLRLANRALERRLLQAEEEASAVEVRAAATEGELVPRSSPAKEAVDLPMVDPAAMRKELAELRSQSRERSRELQQLAVQVLAVRDETIPGAEAARDVIGRVAELLEGAERREEGLRRLAAEFCELRERLGPWMAMAERVRAWRRWR